MKKLLVFMLCSFALFGCGPNKPDEIVEIENKINDVFEVKTNKEISNDVDYVYYTLKISDVEVDYMVTLDKENAETISISFYHVYNGNETIDAVNKELYDEIDRGMTIEGGKILYAYNLYEDREDDLYEFDKDYYDDAGKGYAVDTYKRLAEERDGLLEGMDLTLNNLIEYAEWYIENN